MTIIIPGSLSMLTDANLALVAILIVSTWQYAGYIMDDLCNRSSECTERCTEAFQRDELIQLTTLFRIKIPMIANTFTVCILPYIG